MFCTRTTSTFTFYIYYFTFYISKKINLFNLQCTKFA